MAAKLDEMPASGPESKDRIPMAKWGAACVACATAKAKCIRSNPKPGSKCDRCVLQLALLNHGCFSPPDSTSASAFDVTITSVWLG